MRRVVRLIILIAIILALSGCGLVTQRIIRGAQRVKAEAQVIQQTAEATTADLQADPPRISEALAKQAEITAAADRIESHATAVIDLVPRVQDIESPWLDILWWAGVAVTVAGLLGLAAYLGIGQITRPAAKVAGRGLEAAGKFAAEAAATGTLDDTADRMTTVLRTAVPLFDTAFRVAKSAKEKRQ